MRGDRLCNSERVEVEQLVSYRELFDKYYAAQAENLKAFQSNCDLASKVAYWQDQAGQWEM
eukprot:10912933-Karenia_brevis.AAC.1